MPSLQDAARRGESHFQTDDGMDFVGTIFAVNEGSVPSYDMTNPRTFLRVSPECLVTSGNIIVDVFGRRYLTANQDQAQQSDLKIYKSFRLFFLNKQASWQRNVPTVDPLTNLEMKSTNFTELGPIWINEEMIQREDIDLTFRIKEQSRKIITNANLQLNDRLDNMTVKRVESVLGVTYAEIQ